MRILVTGGTGFLGRHVVWRLATQGDDVVFTGRNVKAAERVQAEARRPSRFIPIAHGEPVARERVSEAARDVDAVVHCPTRRGEDFVEACRTRGREA